ncbi:MAG: hypothetical protein LBJ10_05725, partial [Clostridiales bacterium]|nr:hypothetical protein [Clostridiales bacterium]
GVGEIADIADLGRRCYLLALSAAERGDLSSAARLAARAAALGGGGAGARGGAALAGNTRGGAALADDTRGGAARRLLGLCLFELGDLRRAEGVLAAFPDLAGAASEAREREQAGLGEARRFLERGKWREALKAVEEIPHQSVRLLSIRGCILAEAGNCAKAGELFAQACERDRGGRAARECLMEAAMRRRKPFWGAFADELKRVAIWRQES